MAELEKHAETERMTAFRFRCLQLAVDYYGKLGQCGEVVKLAREFETFAINTPSETAPAAPEASADTGDRP